MLEVLHNGYCLQIHVLIKLALCVFVDLEEEKRSITYCSCSLRYIGNRYETTSNIARRYFAHQTPQTLCQITMQVPLLLVQYCDEFELASFFLIFIPIFLAHSMLHTFVKNLSSKTV